MNASPTQVEPWQKIIAGLGGVVSAGALFAALPERERSEMWKLSLQLVGPIIAAIIIHRTSLGAQLLARAIWWANLGLATILCMLGGGKDIAIAGSLMALGCGTALVVIGRRGLGEASERANYAPPAFRSSLLLLMVLGLADAQTFFFFGILDATDPVPKLRVFLFVAIAYVIGFVGLYRLAIWGAIVNITASLGMILYALGGGLETDRDLRNIIYILCGAQLLAAIPLGVGLLAKRPLVSLSARFRAIAAPAVVIGLVLVDLAAVWKRRF